jgi:hypothetical protein
LDIPKNGPSPVWPGAGPKPPIRIGLTPTHLRELQAGQSFVADIDDGLQVHLIPVEEPVSYCRVSFSHNRRLVFLWRPENHAENVRAVRRYLKVGGYFFVEHEKDERGHLKQIDNPEQIVRMNTTALCLWTIKDALKAGAPHFRDPQTPVYFDPYPELTARRSRKKNTPKERHRSGDRTIAS